MVTTALTFITTAYVLVTTTSAFITTALTLVTTTSIFLTTAYANVTKIAAIIRKCYIITQFLKDTAGHFLKNDFSSFYTIVKTFRALRLYEELGGK